MSSDLGTMIREAFFSMSQYFSSADLRAVQFLSHGHSFDLLFLAEINTKMPSHQLIVYLL
jgi:hypothetical protein